MEPDTLPRALSFLPSRANALSEETDVASDTRDCMAYSACLRKGSYSQIFTQLVSIYCHPIYCMNCELEIMGRRMWQYNGSSRLRFTGTLAFSFRGVKNHDANSRTVECVA